MDLVPHNIWYRQNWVSPVELPLDLVGSSSNKSYATDRIAEDDPAAFEQNGVGDVFAENSSTEESMIES